MINFLQQESNANIDLLVAESAERTATFFGDILDNPIGRGIIVFLNITVASGTGGLTIHIDLVDPASGQIAGIANSASVTAVGLHTYAIYPGIVNSTADNPITLSRKLRVRVTTGDASAYTYSIGATLLR